MQGPLDLSTVRVDILAWRRLGDHLATFEEGQAIQLEGGKGSDNILSSLLPVLLERLEKETMNHLSFPETLQHYA
jgi:hypothetical protein